MLLINIKDNGNWINSVWNLTYKVGWEHICKAVNSIYDFYQDTEILIENKIVNIVDKKEILEFTESLNLTVRGVSTIIKVPIMITFHNQTDLVEVIVAKATDEFKQIDYQKFNISLGQYMDSIELAMYR